MVEISVEEFRVSTMKTAPWTKLVDQVWRYRLKAVG